MSNKFANALKQKSTSSSESKAHEAIVVAQAPKTIPSRSGVKHVGGYFDPVVSKQLRLIGVEEDKSVQSLIAEALDMLFQSRGKPMIAERKI